MISPTSSSAATQLQADAWRLKGLSLGRRTFGKRATGVGVKDAEGTRSGVSLRALLDARARRLLGSAALAEG